MLPGADYIHIGYVIVLLITVLSFAVVLLCTIYRGKSCERKIHMEGVIENAKPGIVGV